MNDLMLQELFTLVDIRNNSYSLVTVFLFCECVRCVLFQRQSFILAEVAAKSQIFIQASPSVL